EIDVRQHPRSPCGDREECVIDDHERVEPGARVTELDQACGGTAATQRSPYDYLRAGMLRGSRSSATEPERISDGRAAAPHRPVARPPLTKMHDTALLASPPRRFMLFAGPGATRGFAREALRQLPSASAWARSAPAGSSRRSLSSAGDDV